MDFTQNFKKTGSCRNLKKQSKDFTDSNEFSNEGQVTHGRGRKSRLSQKDYIK